MTPEQQDSDLLSPSVNASPARAHKPFVLALGKSFTQPGVRRTFNDLARAARVEARITRSISGHLTDRMHEHHSTVQSVERRDGIAPVIHLCRAQRYQPKWGGARVRWEGSCKIG